MENQYAELGDQSSQDTTLFPNDQWAYRLVASINQQLPNSQVGNSSELIGHPSLALNGEKVVHDTGLGNNMFTQAVVNEQTSPEIRQVPKGKRVSRRGGSFTKEEDAIICSAFLNVSKDPIVGVNQSSRGYYKRMHAYFKERKPKGSNRSQLAIQAIDRRQESGKNEQDRIDDAVSVYEQNEPFSFMHCWKILRTEAKWNDRLLELNNTPPSVDAQANCSPMQGGTGNDHGAPARPEGRDNAKKSRSKENFEGSSSSTAVEVLQRMTSNRESLVVKQDSQISEILSRKGEKIKIQKEILETQKKELEMRQKDQEIRRMESEAQLLNAEAGIMCMDLDKLAPHIRNYYIGMQKQIMERRGFGQSSDS